MKRIIAITGGIGAGKSVVCRAVRSLGFPVYDCDSEAKRLMEVNTDIKSAIAARITPDALLPDGSLNRPAIASIVFSDPEKLKELNSIVHGAVRRDFSDWVRSNEGADILFVETAILYESGFDSLVAEIWEVSAPEETRIARVIRRSNLQRAEVERRIASQRAASRPTHRIIVNDDATPLLPQIFKLLNEES